MSEKLQKSVKYPALSSEGKALIVLCFTFLLSLSANFYQFLVSCQDSRTIETMGNIIVRAKTNKIDSLQQQDVASVQPDVISSASDGDPPSIITDQLPIDDFTACVKQVESLLWFPLTPGSMKYYAPWAWQPISFPAGYYNVCWTADAAHNFIFSGNRALWDEIFQACMNRLQEARHTYFRVSY
ncbi:MAG: hypothetical protein G01um101413_281 [Parcubacteria group bacterium Gr01-1014_13]|nr:MAG: hypothetical protein G01um101413_281 [Parcubacteria group bacterium Gr01-1014_13]